MTNELKPCPMRHKNGNCLPNGGFCTSVNKQICEALHNAYSMGVNITVEDIAKWLYHNNQIRRADNSESNN